MQRFFTAGRTAVPRPSVLVAGRVFQAAVLLAFLFSGIPAGQQRRGPETYAEIADTQVMNSW